MRQQKAKYFYSTSGDPGHIAFFIVLILIVIFLLIRFGSEIEVKRKSKVKNGSRCS